MRSGLSDPFDAAAFDQHGTTVTTPKPWPATSNAVAGHHVSIGLDPDGGTCTISGKTSNCRAAGDTETAGLGF